MSAIYNIDSDSTLFATSSLNDGDTILFKTGTTFDASKIAADLLTKNNITVGYYGTGAKPIISGAVTRLGNTFTQLAGDIWYFDTGHTKGGCISEDGAMLKFTPWIYLYTPGDTEAQTSAASLAASLASMTTGSFLIDARTNLANHRFYIRMSSGTPAGKTYIVSETKYGFLTTSAPKTGLVMDNISFQYLSVGPTQIGKRTDVLIDGVDCYKMGGNYLSTGGAGTSGGIVYYYGGGVAFEHNCYNFTVQNCIAEDCFDSSFSPQTFVQDAEIDGGYFLNNISRRCGMSAMEVSIAVNLDNQKIRNIYVDGLIAEDTGMNNWSGNRGGDVIKMLMAYPTWNKTISKCEFKNITATNAQSIVKTGYIKGANRFLNIYGNNVTNLVVEDGVASTIVNQYYNFTDNLGRNLSTFTTWDETPGIALPTRTILSK